jgi:hypothetical protein
LKTKKTNSSPSHKMSGGNERAGAHDEQPAFDATGTATDAAPDTLVDYDSDTRYIGEEEEQKDQGKPRAAGNVGRMPLVPVVDAAGSSTVLDPVPILARSPPGGQAA